MIKAGIVYYRREGNSLVGKWSHESTRGLWADEVVRDVEPGATEGKWPVEIRTPDGKLNYTGELTSTKFGDSLRLQWNGEFVAQTTPARFVGIGITLSEDLIIASFEQMPLEVSTGWRASVKEMLDKLPGPAGERFVDAFKHYSLRTLIYAPREVDNQSPHSQDEIYVVVSGRGEFVRGDERLEFGPGDLLFVPAAMPHRFENFSDDFVVWVAFYGPEGGEN